MSPSENIYFLLIGVTVLALILLIWLIFRKRKKWAFVLTTLLFIGCVGYYVYYPTLKVNTHSKRYELVIDYLAEKYPDKEFNVLPKQFEEGYTVGQFEVNHIETPTMGVTLRVNKEGQVTQIGTWSGHGYPTRKELWRVIEFVYVETYTLGKEIADITKQDEWIEGELTAFALTIDDMPAIALFNYSSEGYELLELRQGNREGYVSIERDDHVFIYIDERHMGETIKVQLKNGEEYTFNADNYKGRLIVENIDGLK